MRPRPLTCALVLAVTLLCGTSCLEDKAEPLDAIPADSHLVFVIPGIQGLWDALDQLLGEFNQIDPALPEELLLYVTDLLNAFSESPRLHAVKTLQDVHNVGIDVNGDIALAIRYSVGFSGVRSTFLLSLPVHDILRIRSFMRDVRGEDYDEGSVIEEYRGFNVRRIYEVFYTNYSDGLFLFSDSLETLRSAIDARLDPEKRFFSCEDQAELSRRFYDCQFRLHLSAGRFAALARPVFAGMGLPVVLAEQVERTRALALGWRVQPEGFRLRGGALLTGTISPAPPTRPAVSPDSLLYLELPLPKRTLASLSEWVEMTFFDVAAEEVTDLGLREFGESLVRGLRLNVYDGGGFPAGYVAVELVEPEITFAAYEAALRPLLTSLIDSYLTQWSVDRREEEYGVVDIYRVAALERIGQYPALAFLQDDLIFTSRLERLEEDAALLFKDEKPQPPADYQLLDEFLLAGRLEDDLPSVERLVLHCSLDQLVNLLAMTPMITVSPLFRKLGNYYGLGGAALRTADQYLELELLVCTRNYNPDLFLPVTDVSTPWSTILWLALGGLAAITGLVFLVVLLIRRRRRRFSSSS